MKFNLVCILICFAISFSACTSRAREGVVTPATTTAIASPPSATNTPTPTPLPPEKQPLVMGAILFLNDNFFETVALGMEDVAKEAGADIHFRFHEDDVALETKWIEEFVAQGVDAILISPRDIDLADSIKAIQAALDAGIVVVCYNGCFADEYIVDNVAGIFETDQYAVGYSVGDYLVSWLEAREMAEPHIGILSCCEKRDAGFRQALSDHDLIWHEVANYEEYRAGESMVAAESMLQKNPKINILWAQNEGATVGSVSGVQAENRAGEVFVFGVDISPQIAHMLLADDDILQAVAAQSPYEIGRMTTLAALAAVESGEKAGHHTVEASFFSGEDRASIYAYLEAHQAR